MTRRGFLHGSLSAAFAYRITLPIEPGRKALRFAVVTDLHHGLAPDALERLKDISDAIRSRTGLAFVAQLGDFTYSDEKSPEVVHLLNGLSLRNLHVLGNHDMDKCDKEAAMRCWGMKGRYGSKVFGDYRFIWLDLNHYRKDGQLTSYANGNYFAEGAVCNWADPEQLSWLRNELFKSKEPVVLLSHQPLGLASASTTSVSELPPEQQEVFNVILSARKANPRGAVVLCLCGHLHVDRLERVEGIPCLCVNSASYFWAAGMQRYTKPLHAFMELTPDGHLVVEGVRGEFVAPPPASSDGVIGRSASVSDRRVSLSQSRNSMDFDWGRESLLLRL